MRNTSQTICITKSLAALSLVAALAACGGGGGDSSTSSSTSGSSSSSGGSPSQTVTGTLSTPQYTSGSAQITAFNLLNQYRAQCGIPALQENTVLDQAAQSHAKYMGLNSAISDSETSGSAGFTGASYQDRAVAAGLPTSTFSTGVSGGASITTNGFTAAQAGQMFVNSLLAGCTTPQSLLTLPIRWGLGNTKRNLPAVVWLGRMRGKASACWSASLRFLATRRLRSPAKGLPVCRINRQARAPLRRTSRTRAGARRLS